MKNIYLILILFLFSFCNKNSSNTENTYKHNIEPTIEKQISLSEIVENIDVIHPSEDEIIAHVAQYMYYEDKVIIQDNIKLQKIQVFDINGDFLFEIEASGEGPGQFKTPNRVRINYEGDRLFIYCSLTKKILQYDWKGNFITEISLKEIGLIGDFLVKNNEIIFLNAMTVNSENRIGKINLKTYDEDKNITYFEDYPGELIKVLANKSQFFFQTKNKDKFYFLDLYSNNLVKMDWNGKYSIQQFVFDENPLDLDRNKVYNPIEIIDILHTNEYLHIGNHINIGDRYIVIPIEKGMKAYASILFDPKNNSVETISKFTNGLEILLPSQALSSPGDPFSKTAIINIDSDYAYNRTKSMDLNQNQFTTKLKKLNTPNNQNPVFIIYHLR